MRIIITCVLVILLLLPQLSYSNATLHNTYEYICQTEGMKPISNLTEICKIVTNSEVCKNVPKKDLLNCSSPDKAMYADAWDFIKGCGNGVFNSVKDLLTFFWDIMVWAWDNTTSSEARGKTSQQAQEYIAATKLYLNTEYQKAYARSTPPMREMKAVGSMSGAIGRMLINKVTETVQQNYREFGCFNNEAKSKYICKLIGDVFIPPAGFVAFLKYGPEAAKQFPNLKKLFNNKKEESNRAPEEPNIVVNYPSEAFADLVKNYPMLGTKFAKISKALTWRPSINHVREIPYHKTLDFRAVTPEEMLKRAETLDPETAKSVVAAYNALNDQPGLKTYMEKLLVDSAEWMAKKGRPEDLELLKKGVISQQAMAVIIVKRLKERGDTNFTTIHRGKPLSYGKLDIDDNDLLTRNSTFRTAIRTGPFFDYNFQDNNSRLNHGRYSHLMQRDIVSSAISKTTGGKSQEFWNFMGSNKGINYWVDLFDSEDGLSFTRPEVLNSYLMHAMVLE